MFNPKYERPCNVYVMECAGHMKVGIATDIEARLSSINVNCPFNVELIHSLKYNSKTEAMIMEKLLHERLKHLSAHVKGEWFSSEYKKSLMSAILEFNDDYILSIKSVLFDLCDAINIVRLDRKLTRQELHDALVSAGCFKAAKFVYSHSVSIVEINASDVALKYICSKDAKTNG